MRFTVTIPDQADESVIQGVAEAIQAAGGTVEPESPAEDMTEPGEEGMMGDAAMMAGAPMPPPPGPGPLAAGPAAGMMPGAAMAAKGAQALRPRR